LSYVNAFNEPGKDGSYYRIGEEYPNFSKYYGQLSGPYFTLMYAILGIFGGALSDRVNRKLILGVACVLWSLTTLLSGIIDSFGAYCAFRVLLGIFEAPFNPCAYSVISDYFHPEYRTTANSIYNTAIYLGGGLSSLGSLMIGRVGWRNTYNVIGATGIGVGILGLIFIMEPTRGKFDKKPVTTKGEEPAKVKQVSFGEKAKEITKGFGSALVEVVTNRVCLYVTIAASSRFWAGYAIGYFLPKFFGGVYPQD
jgi:MFS family permease